jgi:hypothetical protein
MDTLTDSVEDAARQIVELAQQVTNNDYAAALCVFDEYFLVQHNSHGLGLRDWCEQRLHSQEPKVVQQVKE